MMSQNLTEVTRGTEAEFTLHKKNGVAVFRLDAPGDKVNKLHPGLVNSLEQTLEDLRHDDDVKGILITSGKPSNFIAGVDIELFQKYSSAEEFEHLSLQGHDILLKIERFPKPIVACIHGSCMGGGTELSLACHFRVVTRDPSTRIALPEVKIGLLPGMGGTLRLPRLIGLHAALPYLLTGKTMYASQALSTGFADAVVQPEYLEAAAMQLIHSGHDERTTKRRRKLRRNIRFFALAPVRSLILSVARKGVYSQTYGNYPAPIRILKSVEYGLKQGLEKGITYEAREFGKLAVSSESASLIRLFFLMNAAKKNPYIETDGSTLHEGIRLKDTSNSSEIHRLSIIGAGLMGSGVAEVSALNGFQVRLFDMNRSQAEFALRSLVKVVRKKKQQRQLDTLEADTILSSVRISDEVNACTEDDIIIEAIVEKLDVKQSLFRQLEEVVSPNTVLASNTSSLPIGEIFKDCKRPSQAVGMHYFSPVQKMPLLEIIYTEQTSKETLRKAYEIGLRQGKTLIVVKDGPGFYTTRILAPYMNEALLLFEEGGNPFAIDHVMKKAGFPVGPYALLDEVGLDVGAHVGETLKDLFEARGGVTSSLARTLLEQGILGRKSGSGFYSYKGKKKKPNRSLERFRTGDPKTSLSDEEIRDRLLLMMINEAVYTLQEGILHRAEDGDLGAILGLGYPPFLGGPFLTIDRTGADVIVEKLEKLRQKAGDRFRPAPLLQTYAEEKRSFTDLGKQYL